MFSAVLVASWSASFWLSAWATIWLAVSLAEEFEFKAFVSVKTYISEACSSKRAGYVDNVPMKGWTLQALRMENKSTW